MQLISCVDKNLALALNLKNQAAKLSKASSSFELAFAVYGSGIFHFRKQNVNRV